jgi:hypothetical protein
VTHLECSDTGEHYKADEIHNLSRAGKPLLVRYDLDGVKRTLNKAALAALNKKLRVPHTMSALGQKQTWRDQIAMSALPPIADIRPRDQDVCFGPKPDMLLSRKQVAYSARAPSLSTDAIGRTNSNAAPPSLPFDDAVSLPP